MENKLTYLVHGRRALFSDPITRVGGEKFSYHIPTYQAIKGITESIYWKPTIVWRVLRVRVLNKIRMESSGIRPIKYNDATGNELSYYTYLKDVAYEVEVKFDWNENRPDLIKDRNENKHFFMAKRAIESGGRRDIFLGTRECQGYIEPCEFGENESYYDSENTSDEVTYGMQFHSFIYPDEAYDDESYNNFTATFWNAKMVNGIINFPLPKDTQYKRKIYGMEKKDFIPDKNFSFV
ncbi:MAG: type I-C CRISPR-associated protein Cas5 [Methanosarcinaceae archaeon]|nr:type I-C CRISPR-associated protein Cas5 [Methanosarcinaceae archaeon]